MARRSLTGIFVAALFLAIPGASAQDDTAAESLESIEPGAVFVNGRYIPGPYRVWRENDLLRVNDETLDPARFSWILDMRPWGNRRGGFPRVSIDGTDRRSRTGPSSQNEAGESEPPAENSQRALELVRMSLVDNRTLLYWDDADARFVFWNARDEMFWILLDQEAESHEKLRLLESMDVRGVTSDQWMGIINAFQPTPELEATYRTSVEPRSDSSHPGLRSQSLLYIITVGGMALAVFALGTLLSYRPHEKLAWSATNVQDDAMKLVTRSVGLLLVLGLLDLAATISSSRTVGFYEVNPLGSAILENPGLLIAFKISATLASAAILFFLRRYHGAQIAAWWLALFCTVLTLRWVTFNSMLLA